MICIMRMGFTPSWPSRILVTVGHEKTERRGRALGLGTGKAVPMHHDSNESQSQKPTRVINITTDGQPDVYVGRPSRWGNPYIVGKHGSREEVIGMYREWLLQQPDLLARIHTLRGKTLGCWCKPAACHADVLAELADSGEYEPAEPAEAGRGIS